MSLANSHNNPASGSAHSGSESKDPIPTTTLQTLKDSSESEDAAVREFVSLGS